MPVYYTRLIYDRHIEATNPDTAKMELMDLLNDAMEFDMMSIIEAHEVTVLPPNEQVFQASEENEKLAYRNKSAIR